MSLVGIFIPCVSTWCIQVYILYSILYCTVRWLPVVGTGTGSFRESSWSCLSPDLKPIVGFGNHSSCIICITPIQCVKSIITTHVEPKVITRVRKRITNSFGIKNHNSCETKIHNSHGIRSHNSHEIKIHNPHVQCNQESQPYEEPRFTTRHTDCTCIIHHTHHSQETIDNLYQQQDSTPFRELTHSPGNT